MTATEDTTTAITAANENVRREFSVELTLLQERNAHRWNPAEFRYMAALAKRIEGLKAEAAIPLGNKLSSLIGEYTQGIELAQTAAEKQLGDISEQFPESASEAQALFDQGQFIQLTRYQKRLTDKQSQQNKFAGLRELTSTLNKSEAEVKPVKPSFELRLQEQEQETLGSIFGKIEKPKAAENNKQLRSMKHYQHSKKSKTIEKLAETAIKSRPENPGPLNPQMLAIRALTNMKKLSPSYLNRFVAHTETLLWLEKAGEKIEKKK